MKKIGCPTNGAAPSTGEKTLGLMDTRTSADTNPNFTAQTAPEALKRFQYVA